MNSLVYLGVIYVGFSDAAAPVWSHGRSELSNRCRSQQADSHRAPSGCNSLEKSERVVVRVHPRSQCESFLPAGRGNKQGETMSWGPAGREEEEGRWWVLTEGRRGGLTVKWENAAEGHPLCACSRLWKAAGVLGLIISFDRKQSSSVHRVRPLMLLTSQILKHDGIKPLTFTGADQYHL